MLLFHQDLVIASLASGSRGNATYVGSAQSGVLIDCGLSTKQILRRMEEIGLSEARIDAVFITHEHSDHVGAARILDNKLFKTQYRRVPFYMTAGTAEGVHSSCRPSDVRQLRAGQVLRVGEWQIEPFTIPHDTLDPVAYVVSGRGVRAGVITDLGRSTRLIERQLASLDVAVVEFNHDIDMLLEGDYPWRLKQRVRGSHGHLSNEQARQLVERAASPRLKHLILGHLSQDNNRPELAAIAAEQSIRASAADDVQIHLASQFDPLGPIRVSGASVSVAVAKPKPKPKAQSEATEAAPQLALF